MPGPLEGLKKATSIGPDPHPEPHPEEDWIGTGVQGLLGMVGLGDSESRANLGGQLVTAGLPLAGLKGTFSRLTRAMEGLPATAHPNKILGIAKNLASPEEVEYRGLSNFLKGKGNEAVPREDVLGHLEGHPVPEVTAQRIGDPSIEDSRYAAGGPAQPPTKYHQYQLPGSIPGSYREDLLTLPINQKAMQIDKDNVANRIAEMRQAGLTPNEMEDEISKLNPPPAYQSPHWDEPNVLAHVRHNERHLPPPKDPSISDRMRQDFNQEGIFGATRHGATDAQIDQMQKEIDTRHTNKGRMIENVQSDWHQAGAKHGYNTPEVVSESKQLQDRLNQIRTEIEAGRDSATLRDEENYLVGSLNLLDSGNNVPDAPFKSNWAELALKHQVLDVANRPDLEWMGFTPGEELVKRGEGQSPDFNNRILPDKLAKLLKPFGGKMEQVEVPTGKSVTPDLRSYYNPTVKTHQIYDPYNQSTGELGGEHLASVWPRAGKGPTGNEDLRAANLRRTIESQRTYPINVQAWIAKLPPAMKEAILKKGFPLMSLLGLVGANQSQQPEQ